MVLQTLDTLGPLHGYAIAARLEQVSGGALQLNMGTLYPALMRLEQRGLLARHLGHHRHQPQGAVLRAHRRRTAPAGEGKAGVGPDGRHHPHAAARRDVTEASAMRILREWIHRLVGTLQPAPAAISDLEEELRLHLELAAEDARRRGEHAAGRRSRGADPGRRHRRRRWRRSAISAACRGSTTSRATCATDCACCAAVPGVHRGRRPVAGARHRREHRHLQPRRHGAAEVAAGRTIRSVSCSSTTPAASRAAAAGRRIPASRSCATTTGSYPASRRSRRAASRSRSTALRSR